MKVTRSLFFTSLIAFMALSLSAAQVGSETTITSDNMEYSYQHSSIVFDKNVKVENPDYSMTCERLVVMLDSTNDVKWIRAEKNVVLVNTDRVAKCDEALYTKADGKVVMTGKEVTVQRAKDMMFGTRITLWLNDERMECYPARMILQETTINDKKGGVGNILPK